MAFRSVLAALFVQILSDNVTAGAHIKNNNNNQKRGGGGLAEILSKLSLTVWCVVTQCGILFSRRHVAGVDSSVADRLSRTPHAHYWMTVFHWLYQNTQFPRFNSRFGELL